MSRLQSKIKGWVNSEVAKELDKEPFSSLPKRMRIGILLMLCTFIVGHGSTLLVVIIPGVNRQLSLGGLLTGSYIYVFCWILGAVGLSMAGKDSIKYPIYFSAKLLKAVLPKYFEK